MSRREGGLSGGSPSPLRSPQGEHGWRASSDGQLSEQGGAVGELLPRLSSPGGGGSLSSRQGTPSASRDNSREMPSERSRARGELSGSLREGSAGSSSGHSSRSVASERRRSSLAIERSEMTRQDRLTSCARTSSLVTAQV